MPGSIITCQGLSSAYNTRFIATNSTNNVTPGGLTIDAATDTLNLDLSYTATFPYPIGGIPFPFNTGDIVFWQRVKYYAIRLSSTSIKLATSYANAINNIAVNITSNSTLADVSNWNQQVSNTPMIVETAVSLSNNFALNKDNWQSSAFSAVSFLITENIRFDFTVDPFPCLAGISTVSGSYVIGIGRDLLGTTTGRETTGGSFHFGQGQQRLDVRMTLQNQIITVARKDGSSYTTVYTTTALNITEPLRFFAFLGINNIKIQNCIITYL